MHSYLVYQTLNIPNSVVVIHCFFILFFLPCLLAVRDDFYVWSAWVMGKEGRRCCGYPLCVMTLAVSRRSKIRNYIKERDSIREDDILPPTSLSEEVDSGRAAAPQRNRDFLDLPENFCPPCPIFKKIIIFAFLKVTSPQIPYWVRFISKVQNPMYMFTSIE